MLKYVLVAGCIFSETDFRHISHFWTSGRPYQPADHCWSMRYGVATGGPSWIRCYCPVFSLSTELRQNTCLVLCDSLLGVSVFSFNFTLFFFFFQGSIFGWSVLQSCSQSHYHNHYCVMRRWTFFCYWPKLSTVCPTRSCYSFTYRSSKQFFGSCCLYMCANECGYLCHLNYPFLLAIPCSIDLISWVKLGHISSECFL